MGGIISKPNIRRRVFAGMIDYSIIYAFLFFVLFLIGEPDEEGVQSLNGLRALIPMAFWLIMTVGLENMFGQTLGNYFLGLKAIPKNGAKRDLTFVESFKRHLLDPLDMGFFGLVGIVAIKNTDQHQRLGDLWAGTVVFLVKQLTHVEHEAELDMSGLGDEDKIGRRVLKIVEVHPPGIALKKLQGYFEFHFQNEVLRNETAKLYLSLNDHVKAGKILYLKSGASSLEGDCIAAYEASFGGDASLILKDQIGTNGKSPKRMSLFAKKKLLLLMNEVEGKTGGLPKFAWNWYNYLK